MMSFTSNIEEDTIAQTISHHNVIPEATKIRSKEHAYLAPGVKDTCVVHTYIIEVFIHYFYRFRRML